jgi:hypothetical protein
VIPWWAAVLIGAGGFAAGVLGGWWYIGWVTARELREAKQQQLSG